MHWVVDAEYLSGYKVRLTFEDGTQKVVDLEPYLEGEIFEPLRDPEYFKQVRFNPETETIEWPNGADFSPDFLYEIGETLGIVEKVKTA